MSSAKIFMLILIGVACFLVQEAESGKKKGDIIIMGSHDHKCGPHLVMKTDKKKGDTIVMNPCKKKKHVEYVPYPVYVKEHHEYHQESHGYDEGDSHGYDEGDSHGYGYGGF